MLSGHAELTQRLDLLEKDYDAKFRTIFKAMRRLNDPPEDPPRQIGFKPEAG